MPELVGPGSAFYPVQPRKRDLLACLSVAERPGNMQSLSSPGAGKGGGGGGGSQYTDRLVDRVVKASASRAADPGFESRLRRDFFRVESYQ